LRRGRPYGGKVIKKGTISGYRGGDDNFGVPRSTLHISKEKELKKEEVT